MLHLVSYTDVCTMVTPVISTTSPVLLLIVDCVCYSMVQTTLCLIQRNPVGLKYVINLFSCFDNKRCISQFLNLKKFRYRQPIPGQCNHHHGSSININYIMDKQLHPLWNVGTDKWFHPTLYWASDYLSRLELKLIHVSKRGLWWHKSHHGISWYGIGKTFYSHFAFIVHMRK